MSAARITQAMIEDGFDPARRGDKWEPALRKIADYIDHLRSLQPQKTPPTEIKE